MFLQTCIAQRSTGRCWCTAATSTSQCERWTWGRCRREWTINNAFASMPSIDLLIYRISNHSFLVSAVTIVEALFWKTQYGRRAQRWWWWNALHSHVMNNLIGLKRTNIGAKTNRKKWRAKMPRDESKAKQTEQIRKYYNFLIASKRSE